MHRMTMANGTLLRVFGAVTVALLLGLPVTQAIRAETSNGDGANGEWAEQADIDVAICNKYGGFAEMDFLADDDGNIVGVVITCTGAEYGDWTCTESTTESLCDYSGSGFPAPTVSPLGPRAPINPVAKAPDTGGQVTPTPLPPGLVDTLQDRTTAEMDRCTAQGGTPTRTDAKAGDDLHETVVQCKGGGQDGTVCLNTSSGANCQAGTKGQLPQQPVLRRSGGKTPPATTTLLPGATPVVATPAPSTGKSGVIGGITVKPGPAKNTDFTSAISVSAWTCYGPVPNDQTTLKTRCKDLHNTDFEVYGTGIITQFPKGDVRLGNLPAGQYTVRELVPNGYQLAYTYCTFVPTGTPPQTWTPISNVYDGYYEFSLDQGQTVSCNWFNLPNQPYTPTPTQPSNTVTNVGVIKAQATAPAATPGT